MSHSDATEALHPGTKPDEPSSPVAPRKPLLCWSLTRTQWRVAVAAVAALLLALVVLLVVFLVVVPAVFQKYINTVQLSVNYMDIQSLPTDASRRDMAVELSLRVAYDASVDATMDAAAATLLFRGKPFGTVAVPKQRFAKHVDSLDLVVRDVVEITDAAVFRALSRALVVDDQVTIDTRAMVHASALGLSYGGLTLDRAVTVNALANFRDPAPRVNRITLKACTAAAYTLRINATLDNASQAGIGGVGALNLSVYHEQTYLGQAVSTNATLGLPRGTTDMELELTVRKTPALAVAMVGMVGGLLGKGVQFFVRGDHANATRVPLLDEALAALNISLLYTDGLSKLTVSPPCDLMAILTGGR